MSPFGDEDDGRLEIDGDGRTQCCYCGLDLHEHDRERVYPDDGPDGTYHYVYRCPNGEEDLADVPVGTGAAPGGGA